MNLKYLCALILIVFKCRNERRWTKPFHRRFTIVEDFGTGKSALIKIHLSSIDTLVSVTKAAVSQQPNCLENFYIELSL